MTYDQFLLAATGIATAIGATAIIAIIFVVVKTTIGC